MRLLVTRPEEDAVAFKAQLIAQGHQVTIEPLLSISTANTDEIDLDGAQAIIATSRNGLRALARTVHIDEARKLLVFAVGPGTASTARSLGFTSIIEGPSNAQQLIPLITEHAEVNSGPLVHLAGDSVKAGFVDELHRLGYFVAQPIVYTTEAAGRLGSATVASMRNKRIDGVILLSPRTAEVYAGLVQMHNLTVACAGIVHFCISAATAERLAGLAGVPIRTPTRPNLQEMLALIGSDASNSD
ncbi:MAG: uroporphyrinogen-III synthase [Hyphomicrobiaceae bacterium]